MGWWSPAGTDDIVVGDEVFDKTYRCLEELAGLYQEALARKMTVEELATVLTIALQNHGGPETFEGVEQLEVTSVAIKTKKRTRRPRLQIGDIFTIPLDPGKWGFGRIVNLERSWELAEIFAYVGDDARYTPAAAAAGRLLPPRLIDVDAAFIQGEGRWRIVHSQPGFKLEDLPQLEYVTANYKVVRVNSHVRETPASLAHAMTLPPYNLWFVDVAEKEIKEALQVRGLLGPKPAT